jgi:hypothetical protein
MKLLPVVKDVHLPCNSCIATKQLRDSQYCTKTIINYKDQYIPECMINLLELSQADRNFYGCQTYNLGIYSVCESCPLECPKNDRLNKKSPLTDIVNMISGMFGIDQDKKKEINEALVRLNQPEFKEIYNVLERSSTTIQAAMNGDKNSSDIAKKVLEAERDNLKSAFNDLIQAGKITEEEARLANAEINSSANMDKLKKLLADMKIQQSAKKI